MPDKYLYNNAGVITEKASVASSAGGADAGKIPALNGSGVFDTTFMPPGIAADTASIVTSENLAAGDLVNIWNSTGAKVRKADATTAGKEAHGYVLAAVTSPAAATVYFEGTNSSVTSQTPGVVYLSTTAGLATSTPPAGSGNVVQRVGFATSATSINFQSQPPVVLA